MQAAKDNFIQEYYTQKQGINEYAGSRNHKTHHPWHRPHMSPIVIVDHLRREFGKSEGQIISD